MRIEKTIIYGLFILLMVGTTPVSATAGVVPICSAGTPFDSYKYPWNIDIPHSDPVVFECNWDGNGYVYISSKNNSLSGIFVDDYFILTIQPSGAIIQSAQGVPDPATPIELTSSMRPGLNTFSLVVYNRYGGPISYSYYAGHAPNGYERLRQPYIIQSSKPLLIVPYGSPVPEFPSPALPATLIIGFLGAVLLIRRTRGS